MHAILSWPLAHEWIFEVLWIAGLVCAGIAALRAFVACSLTRASGWILLAIAAFAFGVKCARTDAEAWGESQRRVMPQLPLNSGSQVSPPRTGPSAEGLDYLEGVLKNPKYSAKEKRREWETIMPTLEASDVEVAELLGKIRDNSPQWEGVTLDVAKFWMDVARARLDMISPASELGAGIVWAQLRENEGRFSIVIVVNADVVAVPPSISTGVVLRSIEWRYPSQEWKQWPLELPLPAKASGFGPLWMAFSPEGTFEFRAAGDVILFTEEYPTLFARRSFLKSGTFKLNPPIK